MNASLQFLFSWKKGKGTVLYPGLNHLRGQRVKGQCLKTEREKAEGNQRGGREGGTNAVFQN